MAGKGGGCHLRNLKVSILKHYIDWMVLKLTVYIWKVISFSNKPKPGEILIFNVLSEIFNFVNFGLYFTVYRLFQSSAMIMTSLWRHTWDVGTYFGIYSKRRPIAILWYQLHAWGVSLSSSQGVITIPLVNCVKKGLVGRALILLVTST